MVTNIHSLGLQGINGYEVQVECALSGGLPAFDVVGLPDAAVKESRERVRAAIKACGAKFPVSRITINLAPAALKKEGTVYDLPILLGILSAQGDIDTPPPTAAFLGELSLTGALRPVTGTLPMAMAAARNGYKEIYVPAENAAEATLADGLTVYGVNDVEQLMTHLRGEALIPPAEVWQPESEYETGPDFNEVMGQENVKRALEVAAAGGHNLIMIGSPGSGKSMMAKRLPSILPPLTLAESLETTKIHSVAGKLNKNDSLIATRPFRSPHNTISQVAMVGGGSNPQPGEISLAHNGLLFLDELPQFSKNVLEMLRQPLEDRHISISRAKYSLDYPASFMLVASMNPCPCGYYTHPTKPCVCNPGQVHRYLNRISGPLLDRIDIQIEIVPVPFEKMAEQKAGESSATIRERVVKARKIQEERFTNHPGIHCNAQMESKLIQQYAIPDKQGLLLLRNAMTRLNLSARAYDRILKVARTIADLEGSEAIRPHHLAEAIGYRNLDRDNWGG